MRTMIRTMTRMWTRRHGGAGKQGVRGTPRYMACVALQLGLVAGLAFWSGARPAHAASTTITDCTSDTALQNAVSAAASGDTLTFGCSGTITLTHKVLISKTLTLDGSGQRVTLSGDDGWQVLFVTSLGDLTLNTLTIAHGRAQNNPGGGIFNDTGGTVRISNSTIANNADVDVRRRRRRHRQLRHDEH